VLNKIGARESRGGYLKGGRTMRGKKAKALRKKIYGDMSIRQTQYKTLPTSGMFFPNIDAFATSDQVICVGLRQKYQQAKKEGKEV